MHLLTKQEKDFICDSCGKSFSTLGNLTKHKLIHDEAKSFTCSSCGVSYRRLETLRMHVKKYHNNCTTHTTTERSVKHREGRTYTGGRYIYIYRDLQYFLAILIL